MKSSSARYFFFLAILSGLAAYGLPNSPHFHRHGVSDGYRHSHHPRLASSLSNVGTAGSVPLLTASIQNPTATAAPQICDLTGSSANCSSIVNTTSASASSCSTVLTGFFSTISVTDCDQMVTFSTQTSYYSPAPTANTTATSSLCGSITPTVAVQTVISYYAAPWQDFASSSPGNVSVLVCPSNSTDSSQCQTVQEVWNVQTTTVPVTKTSTITLHQFFTTPVVLVIAPGRSIMAKPGLFSLSTELVFVEPSVSTSISTSQVAPPDPAFFTTTRFSTSVKTVSSTQTATLVATPAAVSSNAAGTAGVFLQATPAAAAIPSLSSPLSINTPVTPFPPATVSSNVQPTTSSTPFLPASFDDDITTTITSTKYVTTTTVTLRLAPTHTA